MSEAILQQQPRIEIRALSGWKNIIGTTSAVLLALLFLVSGLWKILDTYTAATLMIQAKVPGSLAIPGAIGFGIAETVAAIFLLIPSLRKIGAYATGALLIAFMIYVGYHYQALVGQECSCFPMIKRTVGPGFFISDGIMLLMAAAAALWSRPVGRLRPGFAILAAVAVLAFGSFGFAASRQSGQQAPAEITVDGKPYSLALGKHLLYFFDPECSHCYQAAKAMAGYKWNGAKVIGIPTAQPRFAGHFMKETGLNAPVSNDLDALKAAFPFSGWPFAVAVENGRQKASFLVFEGNEPAAGLQKIGFIE